MKNKEQKAWENIHRILEESALYNMGTLSQEDFDTIKKLVDKEMPLIPNKQYEIDWGMGNAGECSNCKNLVNYQNSYCDKCGQKLDWIEE